MYSNTCGKNFCIGSLSINGHEERTEVFSKAYAKTWTMDDGRYDQLENKINDINVIDYFHLGIFFWF